MRTLNLGILAHVDAGKTSLTERLLHAACVIDEIGSVDAGGVQQPLGQAGLTGVDVRQDPQVEQSHDASCPLRGRRKWT